MSPFDCQLPYCQYESHVSFVSPHSEGDVQKCWTVHATSLLGLFLESGHVFWTGRRGSKNFRHRELGSQTGHSITSSLFAGLHIAVRDMNAPNTSSLLSPSSNSDYLLRRCWRIQDCYSCIKTSDPCSWCAVSSTCISNEASVPILAPIWKPSICPLKEERWELRAKGTGCKVSTLTLLSFLVAIAGTAVVALSIWALVVLWAWSRRRWRKDRWGLRSLKFAATRVWSRPWAWHKTAKEGMHNSDAESEQTRLLA